MNDTRTRWPALYVLCLATLMIVLDASVVNVALPSIRDSLGFSQDALSWVVNAYLLTFGGFLLLGGRLGDLWGRRRLFLFGVLAFSAASLLCALSPTGLVLIAARAAQGIGGAVTVTAALMVAVKAIVGGNQAGWTSLMTLGLLAAAIGLGVAFVAIEHRAESPLVPLAMLRRRNLAVANVIGMLWAAAMFAWF